MALHRPAQERLFSVGTLARFLEAREQRALAATNTRDAEAALREYEVKPPRLLEGAASFAGDTTKVDVRDDPNRAVLDRSQPCLIDGVHAEFQIPFEGDAEFFALRPSQYTSMAPRGEVRDSTLVLAFARPGVDTGWIRPAYERELTQVREWLSWMKAECDAFNRRLEQALSRRAAARNAVTSSLQGVAAEMGLPLADSPHRSPMPAPQAIERGSRPHAEHEYDVALSFAGEDREYVERVACELKRRGVLAFYDGHETVELWGKNLLEHLEEVFRNRARFVVIFISRHYAVKPWPRHEKVAALERQLVAPEEFLLPVRFDGTEIPGLASSLSYVDAAKVGPERLAAMIEEKLRNRRTG